MIPNDQVLTAENRPEDELLLCCARVSLDFRRASHIRELAQMNLSWDYLFQSASRHGLIPLLYRHLLATCADLVPEPIMERFRIRMHDRGARTMLMTSELLAILELLKAEGISAIPFRGPTLAVLAYGNLSSREFSDLDLLIRRQDFPRAKEALATRGYQPVLVVPAAQEAAFLKTQYDFELINEGLSIMVELHWEVVPSYLSLKIDPQDWWEGLEEMELGGKKVPILSPEHLLLAICAHSTKHVWERLGWICDVASLLEGPKKLDWDKAMRLAQRVRAERMLLLGLFLANDLLDAPLPAEIYLRLRTDPAVKSLAGRVRQRLFRAPGYRYEVLESIPFHFRLREGLRDKFLYCMQLTFAPGPGDWGSRRFSPSLSILYHLFRPFRLVGRYVMGRESQHVS